MSYITDKFKDWSNHGVKFLYANDASTGKPSITLFFAYVTFWLAAIGSVAVYFKPDVLTASINSTVFWVGALIFYRLRSLDKVKFDLDDKSFELSGDEDEQPK